MNNPYRLSPHAASLTLLAFAFVACGGTTDPDSSNNSSHRGGNSAQSAPSSTNGGEGGKGGSPSSSAGGSTETTASAGGASSGGATEGGAKSSSTSSSAERFPNTDEGVFPQNRVLQVSITLPEGAWEKLIKNAADEEYISANVTIDEQAIGEIGLRFKGAYSLDSCIDDTGELVCEKLSLKMKFNEYNKDNRFYGLKRLNFNNLVDGAAVVRERLGYQLFRELGITAPRTSYAIVKVNGNSQGIYTVVEEVDGRFTSDRYAKGNGNLYKEAWPDQTSDDYFAYHLETNEETATHDTYKAFAADMLAANDSTLVETLGKWMDLEYLARYMAVDYAIANWDGITTYYCGDWGCSNHNYYMYQEEAQPKFWLIPWDLNSTFRMGHWLGNIAPWDTLDADCVNYVPTADGELTTRPASCDPMIRAIALNRAPYNAAVQKLLDEGFALEKLNAQIDEIVKLVTPALAEDPFVSASELKSGASSLKRELPELRSRLEAVVAQQ